MKNTQTKKAEAMFYIYLNIYLHTLKQFYAMWRQLHSSSNPNIENRIEEVTNEKSETELWKVNI